MFVNTKKNSLYVFSKISRKLACFEKQVSNNCKLFKFSFGCVKKPLLAFDCILQNAIKTEKSGKLF